MADYRVPKSDKTWHQLEQDLALAFSRWGVTEWSAEPNVPRARLNNRTGWYWSEVPVTVRFMKDGREVVLMSESQPSPRENLKLIQLCVDDMRMIERRGMDSLMRSAYLQLEGPSGPVQRDPYEVLGVRPDADFTVIEAAYKALARSAHPDAGGSAEAMAELNAAIEAVREKEGY